MTTALNAQLRFEPKSILASSQKHDLARGFVRAKRAAVKKVKKAKPAPPRPPEVWRWLSSRRSRRGSPIRPS